MAQEIVFFLCSHLSANWPAGKGPQIGGRGWDWYQGLGLGGQRGITSSFPLISGWRQNFFHKLLMGRQIDLTIFTLFLLEEAMIGKVRFPNHTSYLSHISHIRDVEKNLSCGEISDLYAREMWRNLKFLHMWSNFKFLHMTDRSDQFQST